MRYVLAVGVCLALLLGLYVNEVRTAQRINELERQIAIYDEAIPSWTLAKERVNEEYVFQKQEADSRDYALEFKSRPGEGSFFPAEILEPFVQEHQLRPGDVVVFSAEWPKDLLEKRSRLSHTDFMRPIAVIERAPLSSNK